MRIFVTGANGFIGKRLVGELIQRGHTVTACVRDASKMNPLNSSAVFVIDEIGPDTDWSDAIAGHDMVVHLAARVHVMNDQDSDPLAAYRRVNVAGLKQLVQAAISANVERVIALSSVKAISEDTDHEESIVDDNTPEQPEDPYGQSKLEADRLLESMARAANMGWTSLRPPLVYGPEVRGNFLTLLEACADRKLMPVGGVRNRRSMIFVDNLVDAICRAIECAEPLNSTFVIDDNTSISTPDLIRNVSHALGVSPQIINMPASLLRIALMVIGKKTVADRLMGSLVLDSSRFQRVADWTPPYKMVQGLAETAAWYKGRYDL